MDTYGKTNIFTGESSFIPFRYQGQYEDEETGLYYKRFRYYSPDTGTYISQDPIGLASGEFGFYNYVEDSNTWVDVFGLEKTYVKENEVLTYNDFVNKSKVGDNLEGHELLQNSILKQKGLAKKRLDTEASKQNPVIALNKETHKKVTEAQHNLETKDLEVKNSIETNSQILLDVGVPEKFSKLKQKLYSMQLN